MGVGFGTEVVQTRGSGGHALCGQWDWERSLHSWKLLLVGTEGGASSASALLRHTATHRGVVPFQ